MANISSESHKSNQIIIHPTFNKTVKAIYESRIRLPPFPDSADFDFEWLVDGELITPYGNIKTIDLDAKKGFDVLNKQLIFSYDESIKKYSTLEGTAYLFSHSVIRMDDENYVPTIMLSFHFYTRSEKLNDDSFIKVENIERQSKIDCALERVGHCKDVVLPGSILFIDGPLIAGDAYTSTIGTIEDFNNEGICQIFFVKNSHSNMVTNNIEEFQGQYNSDLHWANDYLKPGQRTNFFHYRDRNNETNSKMFCYVKPFNCSPQRIELHPTTYEIYNDHIDDILNLIYYLMIAQGDLNNPQLRPIAIAEKFARESMKIVDIKKLMRGSSMTPTINEERF